MKLPNYALLALAILFYNPYLLPTNKTLNKFITSGYLKYGPLAGKLPTQTDWLANNPGFRICVRGALAATTAASSICAFAGVGRLQGPGERVAVGTIFGCFTVEMAWDVWKFLRSSRF